jgi:hypothetical protein
MSKLEVYGTAIIVDMDFHKKTLAFQKLEVYGTDPVITALIFLKT